MKPGVTLLRAVALVCTSLALTACGGAMTEEQAAAVEAEALASQEAELGSCAGWSQWISTGSYSCFNDFDCGFDWVCRPTWLKDGDTQNAFQPQEDENIPTCPPGYELDTVGKPATYGQSYSYRACFDEAGNYTHTEYQYQWAYSYCGC